MAENKSDKSKSSSGIFKNIFKHNNIPTELVVQEDKLFLQKEDGTLIGNGVPLPSQCKDCKEIELQKSPTHIQWRHIGDETWKDLASLAELRGEDTNSEVDSTVKRQIAFYTRTSNDVVKLKESMYAYKDLKIDRCLLCITVFNNFKTNEPAINDIRDEQIRELITYAQEEMGWEVTLRMHNHGNYKGEEGLKKPSDPEAWFSKYGELVERMALVAQEYGQENFIISNELSNLTNIIGNKVYWVKIINDVKEKGLKVGCSLNTSDLISNDGFQLWDELDFYGLNLYPSLTTNSKDWAREHYEELCRAFYTGDENILYVLDEIKKEGKPIWVTEFGCMASNIGLSLPSYWGDNTVEDEEVQNIYLEVAFEMFEYISSIDVLTLWCGNTEDGFNVIGKKAEKVLREYWGK